MRLGDGYVFNKHTTCSAVASTEDCGGGIVIRQGAMECCELSKKRYYETQKRCLMARGPTPPLLLLTPGHGLRYRTEEESGAAWKGKHEREEEGLYFSGNRSSNYTVITGTPRKRLLVWLETCLRTESKVPLFAIEFDSRHHVLGDPSKTTFMMPSEGGGMVNIPSVMGNLTNLTTTLTWAGDRFTWTETAFAASMADYQMLTGMGIWSSIDQTCLSIRKSWAGGQYYAMQGFTTNIAEYE